LRPEIDVGEARIAAETLPHEVTERLLLQLMPPRHVWRRHHDDAFSSSETPGDGLNHGGAVPRRFARAGDVAARVVFQRGRHGNLRRKDSPADVEKRREV